MRKNTHNTDDDVHITHRKTTKSHVMRTVVPRDRGERRYEQKWAQRAFMNYRYKKIAHGAIGGVRI